MSVFYERPPVFSAAPVKCDPESWYEVMSVLNFAADDIKFITQLETGPRVRVTFDYKGKNIEAVEGTYIVRNPDNEIEVLEWHEFKSRFIPAEQ